MKKIVLVMIAALCASVTVAEASDARECYSNYTQYNYQQALKSCTAAAEQGDSVAQYALALMYRDGQGVEQDHEEAFRWYRAAAEQGNVSAQNNLGVMYEAGSGVVQSNVLAHMWFSIAAAITYGENGIEGRDRVAAKMSSAQIAEAQALAYQCIYSNYTDC